MDRQKLETIFRRYYDGMFRLAWRMLGDEAEGKDVVSDVFAQLVGGSHDLHDDTLQAYLMASVRNRCINALAHRQHEQAVRLDAMAHSTEDADEERLQMLQRFVDHQLPLLSQQVLRLRYQQGLKYREIAEALGVSEVTVHNHLSQSLKRMKEHFKSLGYGIE